MKSSKRITAIMLAFVLVFTSLPVRSLDMEELELNDEFVEDNITDIPHEDEQSTDMDSITVTEAIYSDEEVVSMDTEWLTAEIVLMDNQYSQMYNDWTETFYYYDIISDLNLPLEGENGSIITWVSSHEPIIESNGIVHRPTYAEGSKDVTLTATLVKGESSAEKIFEIGVSSIEPTQDESAVEADYEWLYENGIHYGIYFNEIISDISLPTEGTSGSDISWVSSDESVITTDGKVTQPPFSYALEKSFETLTAPVTLTATITSGEVSREIEFYVEVVPLYPTDEDSVAYDKELLTLEYVLNGNSANDVKTRLNLPTETSIIWTPAGNIGGCTIQWDSSNPEAVNTDGSVNRPSVGDQDITLTATITKGDAFDTKIFDFTVSEIEEFPLAIMYDDFSNPSLLKFNGVSDSVGRVLQFYNDNGTGGSIFTKNKIRLGEDLSFSTNFSYSNPHPDNTLGEGGFVFTLQAVDNTVYSQKLNDDRIKPSLSVGFIRDYYKGSGGGQADFYGYTDNVVVYSNGNYDKPIADEYLYGGITNAPSTYNNIWIEYDGRSETLEISFSTDGLIPVDYRLKVEDLDLSDILMGEDEVYAGFMGSMGDAKDTSEIGSWYFKNDSIPIDHDAYSFVDLSNVELTADPNTGQASSVITALVSTLDGNPIERVKVDFNTTLGTLDLDSKTTDEFGYASVILESGTSGTAYVTASVPGGATSLTEVQLAVSDGDKLKFDAEWLTGEKILGGNDSLDRITVNLYLPTNAPNGSTISWVSSNINLVDIEGNVMRPSITEENGSVTLTATVSLGGEYIEKSFDISVKVRDEDLVVEDLELLTDDIIREENEGLDKVISNLYLPSTGVNGSSISWTSDKVETVDTDGTVTRPSYKVGNQTVTLTANISIGTYTLEKSFNIVVLALGEVDDDVANNDFIWLSDEIILNGNEDLNNIVSDLHLPVVGLNGSDISWEISLKDTNEDFVVVDGKVTRPTYAQGNQKVIITATISKGYIVLQKSFELLVISLATDSEVIGYDNNWLTYDKFLGENKSNEVKTNLSLPIVGPFGSTITWISSDEIYIKPDGTVIRPIFLQGNKLITLRAVLSKGEETIEKSFEVRVIELDISDEQAVKDDMYVLPIHFTLGENLSQYSVMYDLVLRTLGWRGSTIEWDSDEPSIISSRGEVSRPEYGQGHKKVILTATFTKGSFSDSKSFQYTVLSKPDTFLPEIISTTPTDNSINNLWNMKEIIVAFDEDIKEVNPEDAFNNYGIKINDDENIKIRANISKNKLTIMLLDYLKPGVNHEVTIPENTIADIANNIIQDEIKLSFGIEHKPQNIIDVISSSPEHLDKQVSNTIDEITFSYNYSDVDKGIKFKDISVVDINGNRVQSNNRLDGNRVIMTLGNQLKPSQVYEVNIPGGAVVDRFENTNTAKSIKFRTDSSSTIPTIIGHYPDNGQLDVSVHQKIEVNFSEAIDLKDCNLILLDDNSSKVNTRITALNKDSNTVLIETLNYETLKPNTKYIVKGPYDNIVGSGGVGFEMNFTTGTNTLGMMNYKRMNEQMPIITPMEIEFSASISKGPEASNIKAINGEGREVAYTINVNNNKAILTPDSPLEADSDYIFNIPKGAFISYDNIENGEIKIWRTTGIPLNYGDNSFYMGSSWVTDKELTYDARALSTKDRGLKSITWDFGDGKQGSGLTPKHTYRNTGEYNATLNLVDDLDFSYEFKKILTINKLDLSDVEISVTPNKRMYLSTVDERYWGEKNRQDFSVTLYSPSIGYVADEEIVGYIAKDGKMLHYIDKNIKTNSNGEAKFSWFYGGMGYYGNYEAVFYHQKAQNQVRIPVTIYEETSKQSMVIYFQHSYEQSFDMIQDMYVEVDGNRMVAEYLEGKQYTDVYYSYYLIKGKQMQINSSHNIKIPEDQDSLFFSFGQDVIHYGSDASIKINAIRKEKDRFALHSIKSQISDSTTRKRISIIQNIAIPDLTFEFEGDWGGRTPGYYELWSSFGSLSIKSKDPVFHIQPALQMKPGEELYGRMVAESGEESKGVYARIQVLSYPNIKNGPKLDVKYINGKYVVDSPVGIADLTGGKIGIMNDVPLLDNDKSFGIGKSNFSYNGTLENGIINIVYKADGKHGASTDKALNKKGTKMVTTGYEVEAEFSYQSIYYYDYVANEWKTYHYVIILVGRGEFFHKKSYTIPKIGIGGWGEIAIGSNVDAIFVLADESVSDEALEGIIKFEPYVTGSVGAGIKGQLSVEGYVTGSVPAEVHIPTGYVQVEPTIKAGIMAYYIFDSEELYSKVLMKEHWDNGKKQVRMMSRSMEELLEEEEIEFTPTPRGYLERDSYWLGENSSLMSSSRATRTLEVNHTSQRSTMIENIYPRSEIELINGEDEDWMVWTDDNPERDGNNRTQLKYSVFRDGNWIEPEWFGNDETADFAPAGVSMGDGTLLAWQNINNIMTEENKYTSYIEDSEISVTQDVYRGGKAEIITLTDDEKFDHSPVLDADDGKAILIWTKSEGLSLTFGEKMDELKAPINSDSLFYSIWDGSSWSDPEEIQGELPTIMDTSLTMEGEEGLLLYTLDMDNDDSTQEDREICYRIYDGSSWSEEARLTNNNIEDSVPNAVNINGDWIIIWHQDGNVLYQEGLNGDINTNTALDLVPNNFKMAVMEGENPQLALVYPTYHQDNTTSLSATFYDINKGVWSNVINLCEKEGYIRTFSPIFTEDGIFKVLYTQAKVITKVVDEVEYLSQSDKVDLMMVSYMLKHDLGIDEETGIQILPSIPVQGALTTITVPITNIGDYAEYAKLTLYNGDPSLGRIIGEASTEDPIPARSMVQLDVDWLVDSEERTKYEIYAVLSLKDGISDVNENNNMLLKEIITADVAVAELEYENIAGDDFLVKAIVKNLGSKTLEGVLVHLKNKEDQQILDSKEIDIIMPGQEIGLSFIFSSQGLYKNEDVEIIMTLGAMLSASEQEFSYENNLFDFVLEPEPIMIERMDPINNEEKVSIVKPLTFDFNMVVEKGSSFEKIELMDDDLNLVDIQKELNQRALTITPKNTLLNGTGYTITIPAEAVGDSYGHKMDEDYSLRFFTTSSNPEVIFSYPGDRMVNVPVDTNIQVKLNQNIISGPTFEDITMHTSSSKDVPITVSIEGEWLYINCNEDLQKDTVYSLIIPAGGVKNEKDEAQLEDFVLEFSTGIGIDDDDEDDDYGEDNEDDNEEEEDDYDNSPVKSTDIKKYNASIEIDGVKWTIEFSIENGKAIVKLGGIIFEGSKNVVLKIPSIPGANSYTLDTPVPITVSIQYTPTKAQLESLESIVIRYTDANGNTIIIPNGFYSESQNAVIFEAPHFGDFTIIYNKVDFNDVPEGLWYTKAIRFIAAREITLGTGESKFSPNSRLTRGQFITMMMKAYSIEPDIGWESNFIDSGSTWYTGYLAAAKRLGISAGVGNNMFAPEKEITRQEMFTLLYNALEVIGQLPEKKVEGNNSVRSLSEFRDEEQIASWAREAMTLLVEKGTINGDDGNLTPLSTTTRAEMAQVLYNLMKK